MNYNNLNINSFNNTNNQLIENNALTENSKRMNLNNNPFKIKLKPHQEALLYKVLDVDEKSSFSNMSYGVMSDKPGSGKTYVVLGAIYFAIKYLNSKGANIIVVPHNIYSQWTNSIKKFLGSLLTYKLLLEYSDISLLYRNPNMLYENDIILTTSLFYDTFASTVKSMNLNVRRVFFDEADTIKNLLAHAMPCGMTWFVSASIKRVFDSKNNMAQIGGFKLHLNQLLQNECHCSDDFINKNIVLPLPNTEYFKCKDFYLDNMLCDLLDKKQLSYINGHDYSNIRTICGNATIKDTKDIVLNLYNNSKKNLIDYNEQLKEIEKKLKYVYTQDEKNKYIETRDKILNQKYYHENITEKIKSLSINFYLCIKCFEKVKSQKNINQNTFRVEFYETECNTYICNKCYNLEIDNELIKNEDIDIKKIKIKCLNCNNTHLVENLKFHTEEFIHNKNEIDITNINKSIILSQLLEVCSNKIIIYSEHRGVSNIIKTIFLNNKDIYLQLDGGNIKDLDNILDNFKNNPKVKILLIDDTSFGVGLNIEYATDIIFFNNIEKNVKEQLIGRAQRMGRTTKLNIWELLYTNEL